MNLNLSQIREITLGAVRVEKIENDIHFYRFTVQQEELYKNRDDDLYAKTFATSGVQIRFKTDSQSLFLKTEVSKASSRSYFAFDVFADGKKIGSLDNFSDVRLPQDYTKLSFRYGEFSKKFELGVGEKEVRIYFPWSVRATLKELSIDDGAFVMPIKPSKKALCFGDSITHGYDALYPSNKYITKLCNMLDAEEYNKAIGAEIFFPELAATKEDFEPDFITVAYGTNDWNRCTKEEFIQNCKEFFYNLNKSYPKSRIFAITPIWRKEMHEKREFGKFEDVAPIIEKEASVYDNVSVIHGFDFVPKDENMYADLRLHPNDDGFECYFDALSKKITELLKTD